MQILITDIFKQDFKKIFNSDLLIENFWLVILSKNHKAIKLKYPYYKMKIKYIWIDLRIIIYVWLNQVLIPVFITKKHNKKYWMNLIFDTKIEKIIDKKYQLSMVEIDNNNFQIYPKN